MSRRFGNRNGGSGDPGSGGRNRYPDGEQPSVDPNPFRPQGPPPPRRPGGLQRYRMFFILIAVFVGIAVVKGVINKVDTQGARHGRFVVFSTVLSATPGTPKPVPALAVVPAGGGEGRPLVVLITGRGQTLESLLDNGFYASLAALGLDAPNVAFVAVDRDSQAHDRDDGKWGTYVLTEAVAEAVRQTGADPKRVALGGFDDGGFGALDLARLEPRRFCAVGAHSPEIWQRFGDARPGAFDDAVDFSRHDLLKLATQGDYPDVGPIRIDVGSDDPQLPVVKLLVEALEADGRSVDDHELGGRSAVGLWRANSGNLLRFSAAALRSCTDRG